MREFIIGPKVLDEKSLASWKEARLLLYEDRFECKFCDHKFVVGDTFACTYSNFGGNYGGNPITCEKCFAIPWEKRLKVWNLMHDQKWARNQALAFLSESASESEKP